MFAIIVSGRLAQTDFKKVSDTQIVFNILEADTINHVVVFMTGSTPFPENMGASVYFHMPHSSEKAVEWKYMGYLSNVKASAIFKISEIKAKNSAVFNHQGNNTNDHHKIAQIGISIESLSNIAALDQMHHTSSQSLHNNSSNLIVPLNQANTTTMQVDEKIEFCTKMLQNFYNYATSFSQTGENIHNAIAPMSAYNNVGLANGEINSNISKDPKTTYIPTTVLEQWFKNFMNKIRLNPNFWKNVAND